MAVTLLGPALTASRADALDDAPRGVDDTKGPKPEGPIPIFLKEPTDLGSLWKSLNRPDFVILRGEEYERLRAAGAAKTADPARGPAVVESIAVVGSLTGDLAELTVDAVVTLAGPGPTWVPIRLDGQTLTSVKEGETPVPRRVAEGGAWQVELKGVGRHPLKVGLLTPVRVTADGRRVEFAVPEAASTRVALDVPRRVASANAGPNEPLGVARTSSAEGEVTRLSADLSPRSRIVLNWRVDDDPTAALPPLLVARGDIAIDIDPGSFRTVSNWAIRSVRGNAKSLQVRLDPLDELLELRLDGEQPPAGIERIDGVTRLTIPLTEPLAQGQERKLTLSTRRVTPSGSPARVAFNGFPLADAREQTGAIGVALGGNLWVSGVAGRGVRPIDPRTELPTILRARTGTVRAYQFSEQPFELTFGVEPSPPLVRSDARTTVLLTQKSARVDTWLEFQPARGRLSDVTLGLPPGFQVEYVGPDSVIDTWQTGGLPNAPAIGGLTILTARLVPGVTDGATFAIHVVGRQSVDTSGEAAVALVQPIGALTGGGRIAVLTDPSLTVEMADPVAGPFRPVARGQAADWPKPPAPDRSPATPALWVRYDDTPTHLRLRVQSHASELTHATSLTARVDAAGVDVQEDVECSYRFQALDHLDVKVPPAIESRWDFDPLLVASRTDLGRNEAGEHVVRLNLRTPLERATRFRFRYRLPLRTSNVEGGDGSVLVEVPWLKPVGSAQATSPIRATVVPDPGLVVESTGGAWSSVPEGAGSSAPAETLTRSAVEADVGSLALRVTPRRLVSLPGLVVPRLALRTVERPDGVAATTAWFAADTQERGLTVGLPAGVELQRVKVAGEAVRQVEQGSEGSGLRIPLPPRTATGPVVVELDYTTPASSSARWMPPRLVGAVVEQTLWEVRMPWTRAAVGVPSGWTDENEWYWGAYVWKRRPARPAPGLEAWAGGQVPGTAVAAPEEGSGDDHGYLFGRNGGPAPLGVWTASRSALVGVCSGTVLAIGGVLILVWRPGVKLAGLAAAGVALSAAAWLHPSVVALALQAGMVGLVLTALLGAMQTFVNRRGGRAGRFGEVGPANSGLGAGMPGSTFNRTIGVGSDDSTAIRFKPSPPAASTMDYAPANPTPEPTADTPAGSSTVVPVSRGARVSRGGPPS